jgi:hypothetical protein
LKHLSGQFLKSVVVPGVVVPSSLNPASKLYLTRYPQCSSLLEPDSHNLAGWSFAHYFDVVSTVEVPGKTLSGALREFGIEHVDWLKCDTQGTDLAIIKSVSASMLNRILTIEMEPGLLSAYRGEDRAPEVLSYMEKKPFLLSCAEVQFTPRAVPDFSPRLRRHLPRLGHGLPGWVNLRYARNMNEDTVELGMREYLLSWVFCTSQGHWDLAFEVARLGAARFRDPLFSRASAASARSLKVSILKRTLPWAVRRLLRFG